MDPYARQPEGDWRLEVTLRERLRWARSPTRHRGQLEFIVESKRIGGDVTVSYEGLTVYAYGSTVAGLHSADRAIRSALIADSRTAAIRAFRWDETRDSWSEFNPAL